MSEALRELIRSFGYSDPAPNGRNAAIRWTGVSIFGSTITLATVVNVHRRGLRLEPQFSSQFNLPKRDQPSTIGLQRSLQQFVNRGRIVELFLRTSAPNAEYQARVEAHICEAALYLVPRVRVHQLSANTLRAWMRDRGYERAKQAPDYYLQMASAAACYAAEKDGVDPPASRSSDGDVR